MGFGPVGEVDQIVVHDVVVQVLRCHAHEQAINHPLEAGMIVVDHLDVEAAFDGVTLARNAEVGQAHVPGQLAVATVGVRDERGPGGNLPQQDGFKMLLAGLAKVGNLADGMPAKVNARRDADLFLGQAAFAGFSAVLVSLAGHREVAGFLVVPLVGNQLIGLVALDNTFQDNIVHHVGQGIQNLVPPRKRGRDADVANPGALADGKLLDHALDEHGPDGKVLFGGEKDGFLGEADGLLAVPANKPLAAALGLAVLYNVFGPAMRANMDFFLGGKILFDGGNRDRLFRRGGSVHHRHQRGFLRLVGIAEKLLQDGELVVVQGHVRVFLDSARTLANPL